MEVNVMVSREELEKDRAHMSIKEMAQKYNRSGKTISRWLASYGLGFGNANRMDIKDEDVIADYNSGMTINEIKMKYNASHDTIAKRLSKYGIKCDRASGIKRHFKKTYEDRWPAIKEDLDKGYAKTYVRDKHKIRMDNLENLMRENGYNFPSQNYRDRLLVTIDEYKGLCDVNKRYRFVLNYMENLLKYYDEKKEVPTKREFSRYMNISYTNICITIANNNLISYFASSSTSYHECIVRDILDAHQIKYIRNDRKILQGLELDFYLIDYNIGIEVNPYKYHCVESDVSRNYHQEKSILAQKEGIGLLHLYDNMLNEDYIEKLIHFIIKEPMYKIGARECICKNISGKEAFQFFEQYHFNGGVNAINCFHFGLFYNDELIAVTTFCKNRYKEGIDWELLRYACNWCYYVSGGFPKLLKYATTQGIKGTIYTYVDLNIRFRPDNIYENCGFIFDGVTQPGYFWINENLDYLSRYQCQKSKLVKLGFSKDLTEKEIMHQRGYYQVYTAGNLKYYIQT